MNNIWDIKHQKYKKGIKIQNQITKKISNHRNLQREIIKFKMIPMIKGIIDDAVEDKIDNYL